MQITTVARQSMRTAIRAMETAIRAIVAPPHANWHLRRRPPLQARHCRQGHSVRRRQRRDNRRRWCALCRPQRRRHRDRIDLETIAATEFVHPWAGVFLADDITSDGKHTFSATGTTPLVGEVYRIDAAGVKTVIASGLTAPNGIQFNKKTGRLFSGFRPDLGPSNEQLLAAGAGYIACRARCDLPGRGRRTDPRQSASGCSAASVSGSAMRSGARPWRWISSLRWLRFILAARAARETLPS